ncbi:MAG: hypothetical protein EON95_07755 [Caulobacteraceae bacterium]|nr:MAG: hypothetical protein EON95_07755 [Caulobacteraceae bacterium]
MTSGQRVLARITPAGMVLAPAIMLGMAGLLWLTPFLYGSYERFMAESRYAASWPLITPALTLACVGIAVVMTYQRIRCGRAIVSVDDETVTLVGLSVKTLRLADVTGAALTDSGRMFTVSAADGGSVTLGAGFWDERPGDVAETLMAIVATKIDSRNLLLPNST